MEVTIELYFYRIPDRPDDDSYEKIGKIVKMPYDDVKLFHDGDVEIPFKYFKEEINNLKDGNTFIIRILNPSVYGIMMHGYRKENGKVIHNPPLPSP